MRWRSGHLFTSARGASTLPVTEVHSIMSLTCSVPCRLLVHLSASSHLLCSVAFGLQWQCVVHTEMAEQSGWAGEVKEQASIGSPITQHSGVYFTPTGLPQIPDLNAHWVSMQVLSDREPSAQGDSQP